MAAGGRVQAGPARRGGDGVRRGDDAAEPEEGGAGGAGREDGRLAGPLCCAVARVFGEVAEGVIGATQR